MGRLPHWYAPASHMLLFLYLSPPPPPLSLLLTASIGNVDIQITWMGGPNNVAIPPSPTLTTRSAWKRWALAAQHHDTPTLVQLVHAGRQSPAGSGDRGFFSQTIAPSAIPLHIGEGIINRLLAKLLFGTPREMNVSDIESVVTQFAAAARLVYESGFAGVELHAAHGYLLTQFLSPQSNTRKDEYGGTAARRARIVVETLRAVRTAVPDSHFCIGVKLNSADVGGMESLDEALEQVDLIVGEGIDFLEISGGTYENTRFLAGDNLEAYPSAHREAFFLDFARAVRERHPKLILMVTGGFRSREGMQAALDSNACDLVGIGRAAAVYPHLPKEVLLNSEVRDEDARVVLEDIKANWLARFLGLKLVGMGAVATHYVSLIHKMAGGKKATGPHVER